MLDVIRLDNLWRFAFFLDFSSSHNDGNRMGDDFPDEGEGLTNTFGWSQPSLNLELNKKFSLEVGNPNSYFLKKLSRFRYSMKKYLDTDTETGLIQQNSLYIISDTKAWSNKQCTRLCSSRRPCFVDLIVSCPTPVLQ